MWSLQIDEFLDVFEGMTVEEKVNWVFDNNVKLYAFYQIPDFIMKKIVLQLEKTISKGF
jgi:hypothetical protein